MIVDSDKGRTLGTFAEVLSYIEKVKPFRAMVYDTFNVNGKSVLFCVGVDFTGDYGAELAEATNKLWERYEKHCLTD